MIRTLPLKNKRFFNSKSDTLIETTCLIFISKEGRVRVDQTKSNQTLFDKLLIIVSSSLKGFSQVLLMNNAISGLLILIGITIYSPLLGLIAFLSSVAGMVTPIFFRANRTQIQDGIYSFNSILAGIAVMLFLTDGMRWFLAIVSAIITSLVMLTLSKLVAKWNIPVLTFPFVFVTWMGLLVSYQIKTLHISAGLVPDSPPQWNWPIEGELTLMIGLMKGMSEVFIIDSLWVGLLILVALFIAGWRFGVYGLIGAFVSWITAYFMGADAQSLNLGLYNYNAVLTIIAVSIIFNHHKWKSPLLGIIAAAFTVPATVGLSLLLQPFGLPALTFPFIVCTWLFLGISAMLRMK